MSLSPMLAIVLQLVADTPVKSHLKYRTCKIPSRKKHAHGNVRDDDIIIIKEFLRYDGTGRASTAFFQVFRSRLQPVLTSHLLSCGQTGADCLCRNMQGAECLRISAVFLKALQLPVHWVIYG
eukprot:414057-Pelagomonas_calceolata.AAC.5